ncbi:putative reverse transcriptase domain-containing protein [Tanacetum coccineum]
MSSASSAVTYTSVYTDSEPGRVFWGADEGISDGGSLRVIVYGYDGLPMQPVAPPSPDYIPDLEEPQIPPVLQDEREPMFIQAHDPDYMPEPIYPEYIPLKDDHVFPAEEQPLPPVDSPTTESPRYVAESDPEEDPEEYEDDETEDGPVDYPMDGGDDRDDDDGNSSGDDADDEDEEEDDKKEERPAPADSAVVVSTVEPASISLPPEAEVERLLAMTTPSPSPPISLSPPYTGERLARIASTQALIDVVTTALPSPPLPPLPPSLYIPLPVYRRDDVPESELPPCKRLCLSTLGSRYEIGERSTARPTRDPAEAIPEVAPMTVGEVNTRVTELAELHERDTQDLYALLDDAQDGLSQATHQELQTHHDHVYAHETYIQAHQAQLQLQSTLIQTQHQKGNGANPKGNGCFECGAPGHFKRDCLNLKNKDGGNRSAQGWVYAVGNAEKKGNTSRDPDSNVVMGTFLLNKHYASILFDTGADRSFISTAFCSLINIAPTSLENSYDVELADGKIVGVDTIIRGCALNFLNHPFNIDLMPVEPGSFDIIIGMDWLRKYHAMIVCDEKLVQIPYGNETLIFHSNESNNERESRLTIISCSKAQKYMTKGCQIFLAHIPTKKEEDKSEGKPLKDVPIVRDFPEVFPEDLSGLPSTRPVEFHIDLIPGAALVARAPYRLAPSEMKELSKQLQELSDKGFIRPSSSP